MMDFPSIDNNYEVVSSLGDARIVGYSLSFFLFIYKFL